MASISQELAMRWNGRVEQALRGWLKYGPRRPNEQLPLGSAALQRWVPQWGYWAARRLAMLGDFQQAKEALAKARTQEPAALALGRRIDEVLAVLAGPEFCPATWAPPAFAPYNQRVLMALHQSLRFNQSGYGVRSHSLLKALQQAGVEVSCVTRLGYPNDVGELAQIPVTERETLDGVEYRLLPSSGVPRYLLYPDSEYITAYAERLVREAKAENARVVHAASNFMNGLAAVQAAKHIGVPALYEVRGLWYLSQATKQKHYAHSQFYRYYARRERQAVLAADFVLPISYALRDELLAWGADEHRMFVLPNCVDVKRFAPAAPDLEVQEKYQLKGSVVLGFAGSVLQYEGLDGLIHAVARLVRQGNRVKCLIVGDGAGRPALERLTAEVAPPGSVHFTGRVPFAQVQRYYSVFDICPFPRRNLDVCRLVPPLKPLEAMAMQKTVLVSDVPPLLEMVQHDRTGWVCRADDHESLYHALTHLVEQREVRARLASEAHRWVAQERSWGTYGKRLADFYASLEKRRRAITTGSLGKQRHTGIAD